MKETQFYQELLALPRLRVTAVEATPTQILIHGRLDAEATACPVCCEPTARVHQYDSRRVQDLSISGKQVWLHLRVPQLVCTSCPRYFMAAADWVSPGKSYTRRQAKWVFELCAKQPFSEVAALVGLSHKTVERLYYDRAEEHVDLPGRYAQVRTLGIDSLPRPGGEVSHRKGKGDYVCVLTDLERGIQLDVLPDRKKATLLAHFEALGPAFCQQIEVVACDMWRPYRDVAEACFPEAELVIDRFHVVKALNGMLDGLRKTLRREAKEEGAFKGIKWLLFKRPENCRDEEKAALDSAFSKSWLLEEVYALRNTFNALFDVASDPAVLSEELERWMEHAEGLSSRPVDAFVGTLRRWFGPITAYASTGLTNAVTEGLNNYLRYFKRISFGLPKFEHMRLRILMATA
jgi:transposase